MKRDTDTFLSVIELNKGLIYKVANLYCKDAENRKDLIQEVIIQLWQSFHKYDEQYKLSTWMYTISLNVAISFYKKEHRRTQINNLLPDDILSLNEDNVAEKVNTDIDLLQRFIKELKEMDRAIILLYLEENSQQEIARILGLTVTNVSTRVSRIKQQLQQKFSTIKA